MSISGKYLEAKINGVFISGNYAWSCEETAEELDGTTGEDGGYENPDDGLWGATVNLKGYMDISTGQYVVVRRGTLISDLQLYRDKDDGEPAFSFPVCKTFNSTQGGEIRGKVEWTAKIKSKGTYTYNDPSP